MGSREEHILSAPTTDEPMVKRGLLTFYPLKSIGRVVNGGVNEGKIAFGEILKALKSQ